MNNKNKIQRIMIMFMVLLILFCIAVVLNINIGTVKISIKDIYEIIILRTGEGTTEHTIVTQIRMPRFLLAAVLGGALSVSGYLLQTFFRNPIAGPFVLGISSGAKMFVAFVMIVLLNYIQTMSIWMMVGASFLGSILSMCIVLIFAKVAKNMSMLLVIGIMIGYICSAITDFFITFANESDIANLTNWSMGSFSGANYETLQIASVIIFFAVLVAMCLSKPMGAYRLGEAYSSSMGINIKLFRVILIFLSSILSATVTAFAGPISFVGIAVPHIAKLSFKTSEPIIIIPGTFFCGAIFCMYCDLIARIAFAPTELNIGTVTAIFGAPVVIWQMVDRKSNEKREGI